MKKNAILRLFLMPAVFCMVLGVFVGCRSSSVSVGNSAYIGNSIPIGTSTPILNNDNLTEEPEADIPTLSGTYYITSDDAPDELTDAFLVLNDNNIAFLCTSNGIGTGVYVIDGNILSLVAAESNRLIMQFTISSDFNVLTATDGIQFGYETRPIFSETTLSGIYYENRENRSDVLNPDGSVDERYHGKFLEFFEDNTYKEVYPNWKDESSTGTYEIEGNILRIYPSYDTGLNVKFRPYVISIDGNILNNGSEIYFIQSEPEQRLEDSRIDSIQPVQEQRAIELLRSYDSFEIISRDTDLNNYVDTFTYQGKFDYRYLKTETTGKIIFMYNTNTAEWQHSSTQEISYEQTWDLNGTWVLNISKDDRYLDFSADIIDVYEDDVYTEGVYVERIVADIFLEGDLHSSHSRAIHTFDESSVYDLSTAGKEITGRRWLDLDTGNNENTEYRIYFDKDEGVLLNVRWPSVSMGSEIYTCERILKSNTALSVS